MLKLLLPMALIILVSLATLAACSDPTPAPETLPPTSIPAPTAAPMPTETPVPTESQAKRPTATQRATSASSPTPRPTETPAPPGVLAPLHALDSGATLSELSDAELACIGENPERQTRFFGCLNDETINRIFLAGFVPGPGPLSQESSDCVRAAFEVINPREVMTAGIEGDPGEGHGREHGGALCNGRLSERPGVGGDSPHVGDESGRTGRDAVPDGSTGGSGTDGSGDDSGAGGRFYEPSPSRGGVRAGDGTPTPAAARHSFTGAHGDRGSAHTGPDNDDTRAHTDQDANDGPVNVDTNTGDHLG